VRITLRGIAVRIQGSRRLMIDMRITGLGPEVFCSARMAAVLTAHLIDLLALLLGRAIKGFDKGTPPLDGAYGPIPTLPCQGGRSGNGPWIECRARARYPLEESLFLERLLDLINRIVFLSLDAIGGGKLDSRTCLSVIADQPRREAIDRIGRPVETGWELAGGIGGVGTAASAESVEARSPTERGHGAAGFARGCVQLSGLSAKCSGPIREPAPSRSCARMSSKEGPAGRVTMPTQATLLRRGDRATASEPPRRTSHRKRDRRARTAPGSGTRSTGSAQVVAPRPAPRRAGGRRGPWRLLRRARIGRSGGMEMPRTTRPSAAVKTLSGQTSAVRGNRCRSALQEHRHDSEWPCDAPSMAPSRERTSAGRASANLQWGGSVRKERGRKFRTCLE